MALPVRFAIPLVVSASLFAVLFFYLYRIQSGEFDPKTIPSALIGKPAPAFALSSPGGLGPGLSNTDLIGKVTLVNVFASWCVPCLAEHPLMMRLAKNRSITVVGINYKNKDDQAVAWLKENGNPYARIGADRDGRVSIDWGVYGVPETYVLDRQGIIRFKHVGPVTPRVLKTKILPLIERLKK